MNYNQTTQKLNSLTQFNNTTTKKVCQQKMKKSLIFLKIKKPLFI